MLQTEPVLPRKLLLSAFLSVGLVHGACGNPVSEPAARSAPVRETVEQVLEKGERAKPPFLVQGEAEGLLLVWYDADGRAHAASQRSEIPEERRGQVRVDSLDVAPEARLDPGHIYIADLRAALNDGQYAVRRVSREAFEAALAKDEPAAADKLAQGVVLYSAAWCGACRQAAQYMRQKQIPFVEKDIEKEPGARDEMQQKARAQGLRTSGIPVIDVNGTLMSGFSPDRLEALLSSKPN